MSSHAASSKVAAQVPTVFDAEDLRYLRSVLDEMLADLRCVGETVDRLRDRNASTTGPLEDDEIEVRPAAALFNCAEPGRRDGFRLKRMALEKVAASLSNLR